MEACPGILDFYTKLSALLDVKLHHPAVIGAPAAPKLNCQAPSISEYPKEFVGNNIPDLYKQSLDQCVLKDLHPHRNTLKIEE